MSKGRPINNIRVLEGERPFKYYNPELPSSSLLFLDPRSDSINSSMPTSLSDFMQQRQQQINQQQHSQQQQRQDFHQQQPLGLAEQQRQQVAGHVSHAHQQGFSRDYRLPQHQQDVANSMLNTDPQVNPYGYDDLDMDSSSLIGESLREDLSLGSTGTGHGLTSNFMLPTRNMVRNASSSSLAGLNEPLSMLFDTTMSSFPSSLQQDSTPSMTSIPNSLQQPVSLNASLTSFRGSQQPMVPSSSGYTSYHSVHQQSVAASSADASYPSSLQQAAAASSSSDNAAYHGSIQAGPSTSRMSPGAMSLAYQQHMLSLSHQYQMGMSSSPSIPTERPGSVNMSCSYPIKKENENKSSAVQTFQCPIKKEEDIDDSSSVLSASLSPSSVHSPSSATSGSVASKRRPTKRSYSECSTASNPQDQPSTSGSDDTTRGGAKTDNTYTEKRRKNNESAKRSREARRTKEELVALRVLSLEEENMKLMTTIHMLENEMRDLSKRLMLFD